MLRRTQPAQRTKAEPPLTTTGTQWDPDQYARFRAERSQPFYDLAGLVFPQEDMRVLDLGCGDGLLTSWLHDELGARETVGVDNSDTMHASAQQRAGNGLRFELADIATYEAAEPFDLVFANASLQWIPDHESLIPRLLKLVAPGGQFAMQVPAQDHFSHMTAEHLAEEEPYITALEGRTRGFDRVLSPARYSEILWEQGCPQQNVNLHVYPHEMPGYEAVIEWIRGTYLTAYESRLPADLWAQYLAEYTRRLEAEFGSKRPYLYTYPRIMLWARAAS